MTGKDNKAALREFRLGLSAFGTLVPQKAVELQQAIALKALAGVVRKSPVDTGRFRGNWQLSTVPVTSPIARTDRSPRGTGPAFQGAELANIVRIAPFSIVYLTNALPYAQRLEDGHSKQAPGGMVALTVAELNLEIAGAVR